MENLARERKSVRMLRRDEGKVHRERETVMESEEE
jgi:hypothetical protein